MACPETLFHPRRFHDIAVLILLLSMLAGKGSDLFELGANCGGEGEGEGDPACDEGGAEGGFVLGNRGEGQKGGSGRKADERRCEGGFIAPAISIAGKYGADMSEGVYYELAGVMVGPRTRQALGSTLNGRRELGAPPD